ncbi:thiamine-phosphate kinase [Idiomarina tyrosinivorans]|uniref:Thiamine-monophosphate kinase n=1 Tax=Idiomarina tyrosinivorans TaxID=1445662 RepID=A0A432ZSA1_9GAMM|nr:thiamine-phosphate kinase [Idiomarina tyrosinivorans]RUO80769.1 thiamine-phosphate kinase [Idiomarina tyrosinivorans]
MDEFNLIDAFFARHQSRRRDVVIGIGDDGAVVQPAAEHELVIATDTMVEGVHFDSTTPPRALGHKIAAVNISDLAAMGAEPSWLTLALTLPRVDRDWLEEFSAGLFEIADYYHCALVGGDTTRGPLTLTVTAQGQLPKGKAISRGKAKPGDWIYVSGDLGDAGLGLAVSQQRVEVASRHLKRVYDKLHYPMPRVALGQALRGIASACIDVSDGLLADLGQILKQSNCAAQVQIDKLPLSLALTETLEAEDALRYALTSGDDYELCFTLPEQHRGQLETRIAHTAIKPVCIGQVVGGDKGKIRLRDGADEWQFAAAVQPGYNHFNDND